MKRRYIYVLLCILTLGIGGGLYIIFRPDTYVAEFVRGIAPAVNDIYTKANTLNCDFLKYYLPDFLWAFSLNCGLNAIFNTKKSYLITACAVSLLSIFWETAQYLGIVSGTGDFIDMAMYLFAVLLILIFEIIYYKKTKE